MATSATQGLERWVRPPQRGAFLPACHLNISSCTHPHATTRMSCHLQQRNERTCHTLPCSCTQQPALPGARTLLVLLPGARALLVLLPAAPRAHQAPAHGTALMMPHYRYPISRCPPLPVLPAAPPVLGQQRHQQLHHPGVLHAELPDSFAPQRRQVRRAAQHPPKLMSNRPHHTATAHLNAERHLLAARLPADRELAHVHGLGQQRPLLAVSQSCPLECPAPHLVGGHVGRHQQGLTQEV
mmetsp:Transcript_16033/g.34648  ORF Transcript_16033/g.34648 Transcript_16033/m.34648 type:complete len:241 (-) Transcript_16033:940-1662(-)